MLSYIIRLAVVRCLVSFDGIALAAAAYVFQLDAEVEDVDAAIEVEVALCGGVAHAEPGDERRAVGG